MDEKTRKIFVVVLFFLAKENTVIGANNGGDCGSFKAVWSPVNGKRKKLPQRHCYVKADGPGFQASLTFPFWTTILNFPRSYLLSPSDGAPGP